jgi:hypothetical protein
MDITEPKSHLTSKSRGFNKGKLFFTTFVPIQPGFLKVGAQVGHELTYSTSNTVPGIPHKSDLITTEQTANRKLL